MISTPLVARPAQNWSDLFFIIDSLSYNIDACDLILFMTKINPIPGLENKMVQEKEYSCDFICEFDYKWYPFDTQVIKLRAI